MFLSPFFGQLHLYVSLRHRNVLSIAYFHPANLQSVHQDIPCISRVTSPQSSGFKQEQTRRKCQTNTPENIYQLRAFLFIIPEIKCYNMKQQGKGSN